MSRHRPPMRWGNLWFLLALAAGWVFAVTVSKELQEWEVLN